MVFGKILLVDDEKFVRKGLRAIIEKSGICFEEIRECRDGDEALKTLAEDKFDVVITDIKMPGIDGIEFLSQAQKLEPMPKFIILSGYDHFNYAVECMKYGAYAYLLKPVVKEDLFEALGKVELKIRQEKEMNRSRESINHLMNHFKENEMNLVLLNENLNESEIKKIMDAVKVDIFDGDFYIGVLKGWDKSRNLRTDGSLTALRAQLDNCLTADSGVKLHFYDTDDDIVVVTENESFFLQFMEFLKLNYGSIYKFVAGFSEEGRGVTDIRRKYLQAKEALKYCILGTFEDVIPYRDIISLRSDKPIPLNQIKMIYQLLGTSRLNEANEIIDKIFDKEVICSNSISYLEEIVNNINRYIFDAVRDTIPPDKNDIINDYDNIFDIYNFYSIKDYISTVKECIFRIMDYMLMLKNTCREKQEVEAAIEFVRDNYWKDIDMATVSNHVHLNYSYFSCLFKEHVKMNFVDYLRKVRIDKAMELLKNTNMKISEISERVGYEGVRQFTRAFGATVGISPSEYRERPL